MKHKSKMKVNENLLWLCVIFAKFGSTLCLSYPPIHHKWTRSEKMDPNNLLQMQWHLRDKEIVFKVTVNSRGFVAIGFQYQNPKIQGFDMAIAWVNDGTGKANILVRFSFLSVQNSFLPTFGKRTKTIAMISLFLPNNHKLSIQIYNKSIQEILFRNLVNFRM